MKLFNPTGGAVRISDKYGLGAFGAPRGSRVHQGLDIQSRPGLPVRSPIEGFFVREKRPYGDGGVWDHGVLIAGHGAHAGLEVSLFYVLPIRELIGQLIVPGGHVGLALSLQAKYPGITDHVHVAIQRGAEWLDPTPFFFGEA